MQAYQNLETKQITFRETKNTRPLTLSCGQCIGCKLTKSAEWAIRCVHEAQMHPANSFLTLTLDEEHYPEDGGLDKTHLQKFFKRLRKDGHQFRYYACGEYGDTTQRAHYHVCLFGMDFTEDRELWSDKNGIQLHRSKYLNAKWDMGHCLIGDLNFQTAAYCARYTMKKRFGEMGGKYIKVTDDGEMIELQQPFSVMSLKPAIGKVWLSKFHNDIYHERKDYVLMDGVKMRPPKYYDLLYGEINPERMEYHKHQRYLNNEGMTQQELDTHALIARAKTHSKKGI